VLGFSNPHVISHPIQFDRTLPPHMGWHTSIFVLYKNLNPWNYLWFIWKIKDRFMLM
jgi:hypothetical protein